jgi:hypothetical protein
MHWSQLVVICQLYFFIEKPLYMEGWDFSLVVLDFLWSLLCKNARDLNKIDPL